MCPVRRLAAIAALLTALAAGPARAREMQDPAFDAWLTGPLAAPGATVLTPGLLTLEPALGYAVPENSAVSLGPQLLVEYGLVDRVQLSVLGGATWNRVGSDWTSGFTDTLVGAQLALLDEDAESLMPAARIGFTVTLPTGKYQHLEAGADGFDATGAGAYTTTLRLDTAKTFALGEHAFRPHACVAVDVYSSHVSVHGPNYYGGGGGTDGTVSPGLSLNAFLSGEFSLTQRWALALDLVYTRASRTTFRGESGFEPNGAPASMETPAGSLVTVVPAIEYSWSANEGVIAGMTFGVAGRNIPQAIGVQVQYSTTFELW